MRIYLDRASIHAEMAKRHPDLDPDRSVCLMDTTNNSPWAWIFWPPPQDGSIEIERDDEREDYFGFQIGHCRWRNVGATPPGAEER